MDLKNFEATSTYAIQAVYLEYWRLIPEKYRLMEKAQVQVKTEEEETATKRKSKPLTYKKVEETPYEDNDYYSHYCRMMNSGNWFDIMPFYDPQLDFENRLHYKLVEIDYPDRKQPWFIITWNFGQGLLKSSLSRRRFQTCADVTPSGEEVTFDFINTEMDLTLAIYSNTMQGLMELQENIIIGKREKCTVDTLQHSILGNFPVSLDTIDSTVTKLPRDKGTLCSLTLSLKIDFPVIGNVRLASNEGVIKEIHLELDSRTYASGDKVISLEDYTTPGQHEVVSRDSINENTPDYNV